MEAAVEAACEISAWHNLQEPDAKRASQQLWGAVCGSSLWERWPCRRGYRGCKQTMQPKAPPMEAMKELDVKRRPQPTHQVHQ